MFTLQDFMQDFPMAGLQLLTASADFSAAPIRSISVQEMPLDTFVRENEIILSTLIGCLEDDNKFRQFLQELHRARATALIVCFKDPAYRPSAQVLACAEELGLPLFCIPWELRFAEIIQWTDRQIHESNIAGYKRIQDQLFAAYFTMQPLDKAAQILSEFFQSPVVITDKHANPKGSSAPLIPDESAARRDIRINDFLWGHLYICQPHRCAALLQDAQLLEKYIALPLTLWFNKESIEDMLVLKMKNDFVWDLANRNYGSFLEMIRQGSRMGFDLSAAYVCVALRICARDPQQVPDEYSPASASLVSAMENLIFAESRQRQLNLMFADRGLQFILYIPAEPAHALQRADDLIDALDTAFCRQYPHLHIYWGISNVLPAHEDAFHKLYQSAQLALRYCMNAKGTKHRFTYKDTQFHQIISELSANDQIKQTALDTLTPLLQSDKTSSMDLLQTLITFLQCDGNASKTARSLHLNRQSLLYRLKKIESLTDMSLDQRRDLFLLELFTRIHSDY